MYTAYTLFHINQNRHVLDIYRHISNITSMYTAYTLFHINQNRHALDIYRHISNITSIYTAYTLFHINQNRHVLHIYRHISNITSMQTVQASVPHRSEHASTFTDTANISLQYKQACCTHSYIHHKFNRSMHSAQANAHSTHSNTHH